MKVVQINSFSNGSTGTIAKRIHAGLLERGDGSLFLYGMGPEAGAGTRQLSTNAEYRFHTYAGRAAGLHGYFSAGATRRLLETLREEKPDLVHLHNLHGDYVNIGMLFSFLKQNGIRTLITLHDCWLFTGGCAYYTVAGCERWRENCGHCPQLRVYPKSYVFDTSRKCLADKKKWFAGMDVSFAAVSEWLAGEAGKSFLNAFPITTVYNGIDTDVFTPSEQPVRGKYGIPVEKKMVLGVASVWKDARKGLRQFLALAERLPPDYVLVLVGLKPDEVPAAPENLVAVPRTESREELAALYSTADVFVNISPEETFGLVTAEALACGTPAVVSTKTACPEVIDAHTGLAIDTQNLDTLLAAVAEICGGKRRFLAEDCRERAVAHFSSRRMVEGYLRLYDSLAGSAK